MSRLTHNPDLPFLLEGWTGNALKDNRYVNLDGPSERSYADVLRWQISKSSLRKLKKGQKPGVEIYLNEPLLSDPADGITWLGHASFLITIEGRHILVDPIAGKLPVGLFSIKRHTPFPLAIENLTGIDYILISHNHRDHCDRQTLKTICRHNPEAVILTGLGISALLRSWKISCKIIEAGWYQTYPVHPALEISYLPARHWNRRHLTDLNEMLWGSFMIRSSGHTIYFGADSGMGIHYREIAALYPRIDYSIMGIGAYEPVWFMGPAHGSPQDALDASAMLHGSTLIPMHFGTFDLSDEPIFYPKQELMRLQQENNINHVLHLPIGRKHRI